MTLNNTKQDSKLTQNKTLKHVLLTHIKHPQTYTCLSSSNNPKSQVHSKDKTLNNMDHNFQITSIPSSYNHNNSN